MIGYMLCLFMICLGIFVADAARLARNIIHAARLPAVTLLDRTGSTITTLGDGWAHRLSTADVAPVMIEAIVAIEDRRFFEHGGLDLVGIGRAIVRNIAAGRILQGGSTITQQLAKIAFLSPERSFLRKLREATLALWLDATMTKQEIMAAYLDRIYLGSGITGIRAAARKYFGVEARSLDLAQAALVAGMVKAPSRLDPTRDLHAARVRGSNVLIAMVEAGSITREQADAALAKPAKILMPPFADPSLRTFAQAARRTVPGSALVVQTTLDSRLNQRARTVLADGLNRPPMRAKAGALVAISRAGEILAAASVPGDLGGIDRVAAARRQPGSAFKPIVFAAAIEAGHHPDEVISTAALDISGWRPRNVNSPPAEYVTLQQALSLSINTSAVRLGMEIGLERIVNQARRLGISSDLPSVPSLTLGSAELGMVELAAAYAALSNDGIVRLPIQWTTLADEAGERHAAMRPPPVRAISAGTASKMHAMLVDAMRNGTGKAASIPGGFGKTGTSSGFRDAWFVGGNAQGTIVAVWVGNDDHAPMDGETGGGLPARIFQRFMSGMP